MKDMMQLVEPLIPALRRYARALMRDRSAADDLVQDCLERTISRWNQRRPDGDARTWIFTILHNLAINELKRNSRRGRHLPIADIDETAFASPASQEDGLLQQDLLKRVAALPEEQRSVLLLISVEDLSYAEAAAVLGIPVGTVMSRLSRARERLLEATNEASAETLKRTPILRRVK
jgi:RNA polymerase sigma-70 factor (ECF subfamily)